MSNGFREYLRRAAAPAAWRCWRRCAGPCRGEQVRRRSASRLLLALDVGERLPIGVADNEEAIAEGDQNALTGHWSSQMRPVSIDPDQI